MKKVLLLGGAYAQIPSIKKAKELGYYTITCDYLPDNPGHKFADEYHNVSTTDKEAVLKLAQDLKIDGIVCYASDPAAPTAAYVAEKMGLPGQPYKAVEILANKDLFRQFLTENGFNVPRAKGYTSLQEVQKDWDNFKKPVMVKPVDSSGSKGVIKVDSFGDLQSAFDYALSFSRCKRVVVEEYIEAEGSQILGEGFSVNGQLKMCLLANHFFDKKVKNPFTPVGAIWPCSFSAEIQKNAYDELQRALSLLGCRSGAYNFELRQSNNGKIYIMEIGPRNGGNFIPQVMNHATGVDWVQFTIQAAMGDLDPKDVPNVREPNGVWCYYVLHTYKNGVLKTIRIDDNLKQSNVVELNLISKNGDNVSDMSGANCSLGVAVLKFPSVEDAWYNMDHMDDFIKIVVE